MGRRIPGKKHRGVKDPIAQKELREEGLKHCINAPPKDIDFQEIPKSLERLMKLKQMTKEGLFNKLKKKKSTRSGLMDTSRLAGKERVLPGMTKPNRDLPVLVQKPGESERIFFNRVHNATNNFIKEVNFEIKHNMKMIRDKKTGEVKFEKIEADPIDQMFENKMMATKKHKKNQKGVTQQEGLSKTARRRMRQQARRAEQGLLEREVEGDDFAQLQDRVEFNEVVHRPPQLSALPRKAGEADAARRPGSKPGLLLTQMLAPSGRSGAELTGRRKDLSASDRRRLDSAQTAAIQAYRQLKATRVTAAVR